MKEFALTILETAKIHEESWDDDKGYTLSLESSAILGCKRTGFEKRHVSIICMMLTSLWNDILKWAENELKETEDGISTGSPS